MKPDKLAGKQTTAVLIGIGNTKLFIASLLGIEGLLIAYFYSNKIVTGFLFLAAFGFLADWQWRREMSVSSKQLASVLIAWNVIAVASIYWVWKAAMFVG